MNYTYKSPYKDTNSRMCVQMLYIMHDFMHSSIHSAFHPQTAASPVSPISIIISYSDVVLSLINSVFLFAFVYFKDVPGQLKFQCRFHLLAVALILKPTRC